MSNESNNSKSQNSVNTNNIHVDLAQRRESTASLISTYHGSYLHKNTTQFFQSKRIGIPRIAEINDIF